MNIDKIKIPQNIKAYFNEIAERLWSGTGHAALMIGSGFSKNAETSSSTNKRLPNWSELGDIFYHKLYGKTPNDKEHYLNIMKLADEVQAAFGRPVLDNLIRSNIPDKEYKPSELHIKLLKLPWVDVFTTNYDTLLERACDSVISPRYDVVINKEDLIYSEHPRIIKLHGSFPSERPFIISEEDYRKYPHDFAPFINTVQQSLLENTFCLIGFSGDDPNFLKWIGWIHDNLGLNNSPKIYLIGVLSLSDSQKKLLEKKNIVLVDLSLMTQDNYIALDIFVEHLTKAYKKNKIDWPFDQQTIELIKKDSIQKEEQIDKIIINWGQMRKSYPGWVILPEDRRNMLWYKTRDLLDYINYVDKIPQPKDIYFLFEINWRLEKCLFPIFDGYFKSYEEILKRYNPFPSDLLFEHVHNPNNSKDINWEEVTPKWLELNFSLLRYYREEGHIEKWIHIEKTICLIIKYLSPDNYARFLYERCLNELFLLNISQLKRRLKEWIPNDTLPYWEAKRAGLLAEVGYIDEAKATLEKSLSVIRKQLNLSPVSNNYELVSQESYIMLLYRYINNVNNYNVPLGSDFSDRWNILKQYKCDPWYEIKIFEGYLKKDSTGNTVCKGFDLNSLTTSFILNCYNHNVLNAYAFLRHNEETGIPYNISNHTFNNEIAKDAVKLISNQSPVMAIATIVRIGDVKLLDEIYNRNYLSKIDILQIDSLISNYLNALNNASQDINDGNAFKANFAINMAAVIPELLSRLCVKCSNESKNLLFDLIKQLYQSEKKINYQNISHLVSRFFKSITIEEQHLIIPKMLEIPIVQEENFRIDTEFIDPFKFLDIDITKDYETIDIDNKVITELIEQSRSINVIIRKKAVKRLEFLYIHNLLDVVSIKSFANSLWSQLDENTSLPKNTDLHNFEFLILPHPSLYKPDELFKEYILTRNFIKKNEDASIPIDRNMPSICNDLIYGTRRIGWNIGVEWSQVELCKILDKLIFWWDSEKIYLEYNDHGEFSSVHDTYFARLKNFVDILSIIIVPNVDTGIDRSTINIFIRIVSELRVYRLPSLRLSAALCKFEVVDIDQLFTDITIAFSSKDNEKIVDSLFAIEALINVDHNSESTNLKRRIISLVEMVGESARLRRFEGLVSSLNLLSNITSKFPYILNNRVVHNIIICLDFLVYESDPKLSDTYNLEVHDQLNIRKSAVRLSYNLYKYYIKRKKSIPEIINKWKSIHDDLNEFSEIRNSWR